MRKILFSSVALAAIAGQALAADLPSTKEVPAYVPAPFSWTGFYIGADIGEGWGGKTVNYAASPLNLPGSFRATLESMVAGGHVGYNWQVNQFVMGIQGDILGGRFSGATYAPAIDATTSLHENWLGSINGRLGYAFDRALFYAIGGVAFTDEYHTVAAGPSLTTTLNNLGIPSNTQRFNWERTGYDIGGGIEYAIIPNFSIRAEYRYYDFGQWNYNSPSWVGHGRENLSDNTVTFGVSYLFSAPVAPAVVAKY